MCDLEILYLFMGDINLNTNDYREQVDIIPIDDILTM